MNSKPPPSATDGVGWLARPIALCLDALICVRAPHQEPLRALWSRGGIHSRFETFYRVLDRHLPGIVEWLIRRVLKNVNITGDSLTPEPIDRGRAVTVYRLREPPSNQSGLSSEPTVLKVYRSSLGLHGKKLTNLRSNIQLGKDQLERWYGDCDGVLVPVRLSSVNSPILGIPALALEQPLVGATAADFFRDHTDSELLQMLQDSPVLRAQFDGFVAGTRMALSEGTRCFDMHGDKNLALISTPGGKRLSIVDYGVYDLEERKRKAPEKYEEILQLHNRLFALHEKIANSE